MKPEQLTLHALDRLPSDEAHELESELAQNPELAAELRATENTIAAVWHASSPLQSAPPEALAAIRKKLHPVRSRPALPFALATLGWAAAIVFALLLFNRPQATQSSLATEKDSSPDHPAGTSDQPIPPRPNKPSSDPDLQRETIRRLREELITLRARKSGPRIRELRAPGDTTPSHSGDRNRALIELLTAALADKLARQSEFPTTLVVEDGWLNSDFADLPEDGTIRHRAFPAEDFAEYGLLRSAAGDFYDPASGLLWTPAPDGGGYLGRTAPAELDLALFNASPPADTPIADPETPPYSPETPPSPSGYLVQSEEGGSATIIIGNLPTDGTPPEFVASTDGGQTTIPLTPTGIWPGSNGTSFGSFSVQDHSDAFLSPSSSGGGTMIDFEFLQRELDGSYTTILTTSP